MPIHASPALAVSERARVLPGIDVFGYPGSQGADPVNGWPELADLVQQRLQGADELEDLQHCAQRYIADFEANPCLFIQAQQLEGGVEVPAHIDPLPNGGRMIATTVLEGSSDVRVGPVWFHVEKGDLYALTDFARYDVEHEVAASFNSRLSITIRYGIDMGPN